MAYSEYNPIRSVDGEQIAQTPSSYVWKLEDVSESDAGRTEDVVMHKKRIGQVVALELTWNNITTEVCSELLQQFNPEYIELDYLDAMEGRYIKGTFYVGNRSAPMYNNLKGIWSNLTFNVIRRDGTYDVQLD